MQPRDGGADAAAGAPILELSPAPAGSVPLDLGLAALFRHSPADAPPLRVGVMLDGFWTISCFRHVLEDVAGSNFARLSAVILNEGSPREAARSTGRLRRYWTALAGPRRRTLAYSLYLRFFDRPDPAGPDPLAIVGCRDLFEHAETVPVRPITTRFVHRFPPAAIERIRALDLDVILRFGFNIIRGEILAVPRYGIWSYHHGDPDEYRGGPAHYWELVERNEVSGVMLQVLTEDLDGGLVLARARFATANTLSVAQNRHAPYWGSQHFVIQKLNELHRHGWEHVRARAVEAGPYRGRRMPYRSPTNLEFGRWIGREIGRRALRRLTVPRSQTAWSVAVRRSPVALLDEEPAAAIGTFRFYENPPGRFLADPFLLADGARTWMFVEDFAYDRQRAVISCGELGPDGSVEELRPCLERPHHLSYPHVFRYGGEAFMVPESEQSGSVDLYRARAFPYDWVRECTLLPLRGVDPNLFEAHGRWWMLVTHRPVPSQSVVTLLFHAPAPTGPWRMHPASPVHADVRYSRNAGAVFTHAGRLVRPSQDCAPIYGRAIVWNEIVALDGERYAERPLGRVDAAALPDVDGVHHYHRAGEWEVIDGRRQMPESYVAVAPPRDGAGRCRPTRLERVSRR